MNTKQLPSVALSGLRKAYGNVTAVDGLDLELQAGEIVALLGRNGAGKSTTIDMLLGLTPPDSGTVRLFGFSPLEAGRRGDVGAMLQQGGLPADLTVRECLELMSDLSPHPLPFDETVKRAGIEDLLDRRCNKLSGGQSQRVRFAAAIATDPQLLVLDEPTAAMDVDSRRRFWDSMRGWASSGRTVLFATHHLEEADSFADRIVMMQSGRIVADGNGTELKRATGQRQVRCTVTAATDLAAVEALAGVSAVQSSNDRLLISCSDSDSVLRYLVNNTAFCDFEVGAPALEDAFIQLTSNPLDNINPLESNLENVR